MNTALRKDLHPGSCLCCLIDCFVYELMLIGCFVSKLMDLLLTGKDQSQAGQPNSLDEGPPM